MEPPLKFLVFITFILEENAIDFYSKKKAGVLGTDKKNVHTYLFRQIVQYDEADFSQANLIDKLQKLLEAERKNAKEMESIYYRSRNGKPFNFGKLASRTTDAK